MSLQETRKISKILSELANYLMRRGYMHFSVSVNRGEHKSEITLNLPNVSQQEMSEMITKVGAQADPEVEMYGWELMGEAGSKDELTVLGMLIKSVNVIETKDNLMIIFERIPASELKSK